MAQSDSARSNLPIAPMDLIDDLPSSKAVNEQLGRENDLLREALALAIQGLSGCVDEDRDDLWTVTAKRGIGQLHALGFCDERGVLYSEHTPMGWGVNPRYGIGANGRCVACDRPAVGGMADA